MPDIVIGTLWPAPALDEPAGNPFECDTLDCRHEDDAGYCRHPKHDGEPCTGPCKDHEEERPCLTK